MKWSVRWAVACGLAVLSAAPGRAEPLERTMGDLSVACRRAITAHQPTTSDPAADAAVTGPQIFEDSRGDLSIGWSRESGRFYANGEQGEKAAAAGIGAGCEQAEIVVFSGATGGTERWYIRRDGFGIRHHRNSGYPGDRCKYDGWGRVPFAYDPRVGC